MSTSKLKLQCCIISLIRWCISGRVMIGDKSAESVTDQFSCKIVKLSTNRGWQDLVCQSSFIEAHSDILIG